MTATGAHATTTWQAAITEQEPPGRGLSVLAERLAAWLSTHPAGWQLPRLSELARKFGVSTAEISAAITCLASRRLIRQLANGQFYRASPADYLITLDHLPGLGAYIDPMGNTITRVKRRISRKPVPDDIRHALQIPPGAPVCCIHHTWATGTSPAAMSVTYLPGELAEVLLSDEPEPPGPDTVLDSAALARMADAPMARPAAVYLELQPPPHGIARGLRLREGEPAFMVTVMFTHPPSGSPLALTVVALRPELFRISIEAPQLAPPDSPVRDLAHTVQDQELP
jgi:DNA-binding GntR family transcriptional regulator